MKRTQAIDLELLFRRGIRDEVRHEALATLSKAEGEERTGGVDRGDSRSG